MKRPSNLIRSTRATALGCASALVLGGAAAAQTSPSGGTIEELIVTAQKRAEDVQTVPLSVTALTAAAIERLHIQDLKDITGSMPNVQINVNAGVAAASQISIRGIGVTNQPSPFAGFEVATVIDGVPAATVAYGLTDQFDVERIEILRGPQGTLFGASTTGGVVNVVMRQPTGENGGYGTITAGNFNRMDVAGAVNMSLIEGILAAKVAVSHRSRDGWFTNLYNGDDINHQNSSKIRAYLRWTPNDKLDVTWASEYQRLRNGDILLYNLSYPGEAFYRPQPLGFDTYVDVPNNNKIDIFSNTITANYESAIGTLTSITNFSSSRAKTALDFDSIDCFCYATFGWNRSYQGSQEIRNVFHPVEGVEVLVGGFAQLWADNSDGVSLPAFASPTLVTRGQTKMKQSTLAGFTQVYWDVTDRLRVQGGLRVSWEKVRLSRANYSLIRAAGTDPMLGRSNLIGAVLLPQDPVNTPNSETEDWTNWGGKVGADYKLTDDVMVYGYYARGFKTGGFNGRVSASSDIGPFNPEFVDSFELGFKSDWFNNSLRINAAAFLNKWKDMQVTQTVFRGGGTNLSSVILNAGAATTKGAEAEIQWAPIRGLRFDATVGYLKARYDEFPSGNGPLCPPLPAEQPLGCSTDYSGRPLAYAPKWNYSLTGSYSFDFVGGEMTAMAQYTHNDKKWGSYTQSPTELLPAVDLVNASLSWQPATTQWGLAFWVRNLTNETYVANALDVPPLFTEAVLGNPREYGVDFKFNF